MILEVYYWRGVTGTRASASTEGQANTASIEAHRPSAASYFVYKGCVSWLLFSWFAPLQRCSYFVYTNNIFMWVYMILYSCQTFAHLCRFYL